MILPSNGKVVVIDDNYDDVKNLLQTLSKKGVPFLYYKDEWGLDLPDVPIKNVRLIFLDLQLISGQTMDDHAIISAIGARLEKILEKDNNYVLVYWSTKKEKYQKVLEAAFETRLQDFKPIVSLSLNKNDTVNLQAAEAITHIVAEFDEKSSNFSLFKVFALWENLVNDSAGSLINDFTNLIGKDSNWDESAKHLLYKLAQAYSGKRVGTKDTIDQLKDAFFTLNHTFMDTVENTISGEVDRNEEILMEVIPSLEDSNGDVSAKINKKLLISEIEINGLVPGSVFFIEEDLNLKKELIEAGYQEMVSNDKIPAAQKDNVLEKARKKADEEIAAIEASILAFVKNYNFIINSLIQETEGEERTILMKEVLASSVKLELNTSPLCDYAQVKLPCCRLLPGLLIENRFIAEKKLNAKNAYNYLSDGVIEYRGIEYRLILDFRFLYSKPEKLIRQKKSSFKLRHQFLSDIQLNLGSHINRSGVLYVQ